MRAILWVLLLGVIGGGLLLWLTDSAEDGNADGLEEEHAADYTREEGPEPLRVEARDVIVVERPDAWPPDLLRDGRIFGDPRAVDEVEIVSPTGAEYSLTGAQVLAILERKFRGTTFQFRFKDQDHLEAFKKCTLKGPIPAHAPLRLVLDQSMFSGFAFVSYGGKAYVTPIEEGEFPGAGEVPPAPIEGVEPETRGPK